MLSSPRILPAHLLRYGTFCSGIEADKEHINPDRPVLRYHGGKWKLAPWIIGHFPSHHAYVEPYGGGASVLLRKPVSVQEVYNDLDGEIVNLFKVLRDPHKAARLKEMVELTPFARVEYDLSHRPADDPIEQARRTLVRAFMGFGSASVTQQYRSGFRSKRAGSSLPSSEWSRYPASIVTFVRRLQGVTVECSEALSVLQRYDTPRTLFYVDPPYLPETRTSHGASYRHEMSVEDHEQLAHVLQGLLGMVVLSGYDSPLYCGLYHSWKRIYRATRAASNAERTECLWLSPRAVNGLNRLHLRLY